MTKSLYLVAGVTTAGVVALLRSRVIHIEVEGDSMAPTLRHRDRVLGLRTLHAAPERLVGRAVVFDSPLGFGPPLLVKRVVRVDAERRLIVEGDNPVALGSAQFGPIAIATVRGVATWSIGRRVDKIALSRLR